MPRTFPKVPKPHLHFARSLRRSGNPSEKLLWSRLRRRAFLGLKFRRQVPYGPYILDFYCPSKKIVIEIDGRSHYEDNGLEKDRCRDKYLQCHGLSVIRIGHKEALADIDGILRRIKRLIEKDPPLAPP